jgi:hypothetical protein
MRVRFLSGEPNRFKADIEKTIETIKDREREYCFMMFFEQQFDKMEKTGMRAEPALGWSATFMKEGMALMLLMLYEGTDLPEGMCAMRDRVMLSSRFSACDLYCGTYVSDYKSDMEEFFAIFDSWKSTVELSDQEREKWLEKIALWMSKRTEAITLKGRTKYYGECASYIAAIGEVRQSRGDIGAKSRIMEQYRREYPRHRSLHAELRRFGMKM